MNRWRVVQIDRETKARKVIVEEQPRHEAFKRADQLKLADSAYDYVAEPEMER